ncbi:Pca regulon regulatory protein [Variovorax sp. SRS16]|uniref:IclR family transcriptional regulator n=1 Tax=Variovorax sp. SRS16 TaxID=282217 RepID=UPI0013174670|nr:IclR family transcriptional regulator [Variovorax sp. SRS16]VTU17453.1 Pca regulon regulatory protein [Variovorax sp. SRS16]
MGRPSRKDKIVQPDYSEGIQIKTEDEDPRFNNALARGLAILRAFHVDIKLLGNLEIAELTGLPKSTVSRLSFTLTQLGYLRYRPEFGKYELAAGVVGLAYPYLAGQVVPPVARPLMVELALKSKTNVGLGVQEGMSVLYLEYALGEANPNRLQRAGFRVPLVRTGMGRACIAGMRPEQREQFYVELREHYKREWPKLHDELEDAAGQVQTRGFCIAAGTFRSTTNSVAVPFIHGDGQTIMAFNCQGHSQTHTPDAMLRNGKRLLELAAEVRRRLADAPHGHGPSLGH